MTYLLTFIGMTIKRGILCILVGAIAVNTFAQKSIFSDYEIGLFGSGGLSALRYTPANGSTPSYDPGYSFGWDVALFFTKQLAFRTGINMASYNAHVSFDRQENRYPVATPDGLPADSRFYLVAEYQQYEEQQEALYVRFPLMVQYRMPGEKARFYTAAGFQIGLRANATYRIRSGAVTTKGYSDYTWQYYEGFPGHNFDTYPNVSAVGKLDFGVALSGVLETGVIWKINEGSALYTGIFVEYGINDIRKGNPSKESIVYDSDSSSPGYRYNSILHSQTDGTPITGKVQPFAVGLRLRWSIRFDKD